MNVVEITGLIKTYQQQQVLNGLDLTIAAGTVVGLLGRNGTGKSSLLECLLGLRDKQAGRITLFGEDLISLSKASKAKIGFVPQSNEAFSWLTVAEMFAYMSQFYPRWNHKKVDHLVQQWDLDKAQVIAKLSVGQRQRVSIIRALAPEPELLVLDEPVASLDPAARREFLQELMEIVADQQTTILFSTHIFSDLERVALDIALLHDGRIVLQQNLDDLLDTNARLYGSAQDLRTFLAQHTAIKQLTPISTGGAEQHVLVQNLTACQLPIQAASLRSEKLNLEDLFIAITASSSNQ